MLAAPVLALLGSVDAPAQAGDFDGPYRYDYGANRDNYDPSGYSYDPYRYQHRCSSCGCSRCGCGGCQSSVRSGGLIERRYRYKSVEREYIERRYASPVRRFPRYGYASSRYAYPGYRSWSTRFPWGYGGVRGQQAPYGWGPSAYYNNNAWPQRPPAPVGYDAGPYGDEGRRWDPE